MKTSILQLLDEKPLRVRATEESIRSAAVQQRPVQLRTANSAGSSNVRSLLVSFLLLVLTYYVVCQFLG